MGGWTVRSGAGMGQGLQGGMAWDWAGLYRGGCSWGVVWAWLRSWGRGLPKPHLPWSFSVPEALQEGSGLACFQLEGS